MRFFNLFTPISLFLVFSISSISTYGNTIKINSDNFNEIIGIPDTACGLTDTVIQLTLPTCMGGMDAIAEIQIEGATSALLARWDNDSTGFIGRGLSVGKHYVTVTDLEGCMLVDSIEIMDKAPLTYTIAVTDALCIGVGNGSITISDSTSLNYNWSNGDSTNSINNLATGIYQVTISDSLGCFMIETITVGTTTQASAEIQGTDASCLGVNDGIATVNDTLDVIGYSFLWSNGDTTQTINSIRTGTYFVLVTSPEGCLAADSIDIGVQREVPLEFSVTNPICEGVANGSITVNDTLDTTGMFYGWNTGDTTQSITNLTAGTYSVAIADSLGCVAAKTVTLTNERTFSFESEVSDASCEIASNGSITINDTTDVTGFSFNWSNGDTTQTSSGLMAGDFTVTVSDAVGCTASDTLSVSINPTLSISSSSTDATCNGLADGTATVTENSGAENLTYAWSNGDSTAMITGLLGGTYTVTVSDAAGCEIMDTVSIGLTRGISVSLTSTDAACFGVDDGSIDLVGTPNLDSLTFNWNNGDSTSLIENLGPGIYGVTLTDQTGCIETRTDTIGLAFDFQINLSKSDVTCAGIGDGSISVNEGRNVDGYNFRWSNGDSTQTITNLSEGNYSVFVRDSIGCIDADSLSILALNSLEISLEATNVSCSGLTDGNVSLAAPSDTTLSISWSTGATTATVNNLGIGTYSVMVTDTAGCVDIDSIMVEADSSLQINLTGNSINCVGIDDGLLNAGVIGISDGTQLTFLWNTGDTTGTITDLAPGTYEVTVTDTTGCFGIGGTDFNEPDSINISFVTSPVLCMDTIGSGAILANVTGGAGNFTYNWNTGDSTTAIGQLLAGTYTLTVTDSLGCTYTDSITLENPPILIVSANLNQDATCEGTGDGSASVDVSGGTSPYQIAWSNGTNDTTTINNLNPGLYTVTVSDEAGCRIVDSATVGQTTDIQLTVTEISSASTENIADGIATVSAIGGLLPYTFNWDNGAVGDSVTNLSSGIHEVVATDANGCTATGSVDIRFFDLFVNIIEVRDLVCYLGGNGRATAAPSGGTAPFQYRWSTGDTTATVNRLPGGTHNVTVTSSEGSRGRATVTINEPEPVYFNLEIIPPGCPNSSDGIIRINATGFEGNALYDFGIGITSTPFIRGVTAGDKRYRILYGNCRVDTFFTIESISPNLPAPNFGVESTGTVATFLDSTVNEPFSYLWKFGDGTTSSEENPVHIYPDTGNYEVCLIVSNACGTDSLCQQIVITPVPVAAVGINFGRDTSALKGELVSIPVTVGDFGGVVGISGTFELSNPNIGTIQNVRELNLPNLIPENFGFQQNLFSIDWSVPDTNVVSLEPGTQIFVVDVLLTGDSDACSQIIATSSESTLQFTKTFMGELVPAPFTITSAEFCVAQTVSIGGNVSNVQNEGINGVSISLNAEEGTSTNTDGNYNIPTLPGGATFNINPTKTDDLLLGVTTFDIVRILRHILTQEPLTTPYDVIAADIDNSGAINSLDLIQLQRLILQQIDAFPNNQPWRFVPAIHVFDNPENPLGESFPESITLSRLQVDTTNIDFVAIKTGDVIRENEGSARRSPNSMIFDIKEKAFKSGDIISVPFNFEAKDPTLGFQLAINFDPSQLAFKGVKEENYLNLNATNIGTKALSKGQLKIIWVNPQQMPIRPQGNGLFQLEFEALMDGDLANALNINNSDFPAQYYSNQSGTLALQPIDFQFTNAKTEVVDVLSAFNLIAGEGIGDGGCGDGLDNDNDGLIDCADADCFCECNEADNGNLIINPSAELPLSSGGWELVSGSWTTRGSNPSPNDGAAYFYPLNSENGQLRQVIDLSADSVAISQGNATYTFSGFVRSFDQQPSDETQVILEYKDANDSTLANYDSGIIASLSDWLMIGDTTVAPTGTVSVIINLIAIRKNGSNNDAYFDNLSFTKEIDEVCVSPCESLELLTLVSEASPIGNDGTASVNLVGGTGPVSFVWSTGDSTATLDNLAAGMYSVEVSDSIGCTLTETIEVTADSSFLLDFQIVDNTCNGDNQGQVILQIIGGTAPFSIIWSDSTFMGDTLNNLAGGDYMVTVTDSTGIAITGTATVSTGAEIALNIADSKIVNVTCSDDADGSLSLVAQGGIGPYTYIINDDTTNNGVYMNLGMGTYTVVITDSMACSTQSTVEIVSTSSPVVAGFNSNVDDVSVNLTSTTVDSSATYSWTFGDGNTSSEINPSITYAQPGTYEICLAVRNSCGADTICETLTVGINGPVTFIVNGLNGIGGDTVEIPVTVQNFVDVVSFQKTLQIQDTAIARFAGVIPMNLDGLATENFFQVNDHTITNVWFDATSQGQTLANNTVLYHLVLVLNSQIDTCIGIDIINNPVARQVVGIMGGEVAEIPFETVNGEICTIESVSISGTIERETGSAVPGVIVAVDSTSATVSTDIDGIYSFSQLSIGGDYEIRPTLNEPFLEGVSTFDIVLANRHILGTRFFDSPYKHIAADVNQSGSITVFDLVLVQRAILGLNDEFPGNNAFRFVPKAYKFIDPNNPLKEDFPESITVTDLSQNLEMQDFVAIKVGDVSYNVPSDSSSLTIATSRTAKTLALSLDNQAFSPNELISVPFSTEDLNSIVGFQLELDFDQNVLELVDIVPTTSIGLDENNFGLKYINQGKIQMIWVAPEIEMSKENTTLFELQFKTKTNGQLDNQLILGQRYLSAESYSQELGIGNIQLKFKENQSKAIEALSLYPNPNKGHLTINFDNTKQEKVQMLLYNLTGQIVKEWKGIEGNTTSLDLTNQADGTYLLMLKRADSFETKRLIINR